MTLKQRSVGKSGEKLADVYKFKAFEFVMDIQTGE